MDKEHRLGRIGQVKIYIGKCFRAFVNEKGWKCFISTLIMSIILAWVIGENTFEIFESTRSGVFALICGCIWTGLFNSIQSICREREIIKREHRTGLHISSYIVAHMIYDFVICLVEAIIMTSIFAMFRSFPDTGVVFSWVFVDFLIGFTLVIFCADSLGILISCIVKTTNAAMTVMPFVLIVQLVMSGMMFTLPDNADFIKELTISKWGLSAVCSSADINELPNRDTLIAFEEAKIQYPEIESWEELDIEQEPDEEFDASVSNVIKCWTVLSGYSLLYGIIGTVFLKFVDKDKR